MRGDSPSAAADLLTVAQAAQQAGVSLWTINGWITSGHLPAVLIAGRRHIRPAVLTATQALVHAGEVVPAWQQDRQRVETRLRALREAAGLTQLQLAAASGLTHEAISHLEVGRRSPLAETVRKLARGRWPRRRLSWRCQRVGYRTG